MLSTEDNDLITDVSPGTPMGNLLRRYWIPVLVSDEIPKTDSPPVRVTLLCEKLVAFRDSNNKIGLVDEHCPHRRASLFFGRNEEGGLRCVYHGWKFDACGQCVDMPSEPTESNFKEKVKIKSYPCKEFGGVIWTYMGPAERMPELPPFAFGNLAKDQRIANRYLHEYNFLQGIEGAVDSSHISFLHSKKSLNRTEMQKVTHKYGNPKFEVSKTDYGMLIGAKRLTDVPNILYWRITQYVMPWYQMIPPIALKSTPEDSGHMTCWVPIDNETCMNWRFTWDPVKAFDFDNLPHAHPGKVPGTQIPLINKSNNYMLDREKQKSGESFTGIPEIMSEDQAMQESQGNIADRTKERLGTSDTAIIVCRRILLDAAKTVERGGTPPGLDPEKLKIRSASVMLPDDVPFQEGAKEFLVLA